MALSSSGVYFPQGSDAFDPAGDSEKQARSLDHRLIIPVANIAERNTVAASLKGGPTTPVHVFRADAGAGLEHEYWVGGNWRTLAGDGPWTDMTLADSWGSALQVQYRVQGGTCELRGSATCTTALPATTYVNLALSLPAGLRGEGAYPVMPVGIGRLGAGPVAATGCVNIRSDGGLRFAVSTAQAANLVVTLDGVKYRVS